MRAILNIAISHVQRSLRPRGTIISTFVVPAIMIIFLGNAIGSRSTDTQIYDVLRSADTTDDLAVRFVDLFRAQGQQGTARFIVCDLSAPADQPAQCQLSAAPTNSDLKALAASRM
jgi:hypothetical protein